jgi:hypothetical protein
MATSHPSPTTNQLYSFGALEGDFESALIYIVLLRRYTTKTSLLIEQVLHSTKISDKAWHSRVCPHPPEQMPVKSTTYGHDSRRPSIPTTQANQSSPGCLRKFLALLGSSLRNTASAKWKMPLQTCSVLFKRFKNKNTPGTLSSFWKLPLELRQLCYQYAMAPHATPEFPYDAGVLVERDPGSFLAPVGHPYCLPAICKVSKALYKESVPVFIANTIFRLQSPAAANILTSFLGTLADDAGFRSVRVLYIDVPDSQAILGSGLPLAEDESIGPYMRLAQQCEGLRELALFFWVDELVRWKNPEVRNFLLGTLVPKTVDEMVQEYRLGGLLRCGRLRRITLAGRGWGSLDAVLEIDPHPALNDTAVWMQQQCLLLHNRTLEVELR